jgi:hypothetical protein
MNALTRLAQQQDGFGDPLIEAQCAMIEVIPALKPLLVADFYYLLCAK